MSRKEPTRLEVMRKDSLSQLETKEDPVALTGFLGGLPQPFLIVDAHWQIILFNKASEKLLLKQSKEVLGKSLWDLFEREADSILYSQLSWAKASQGPVLFDTFHASSGAWFRVYASYTSDRLYIYLYDISREKLAKEALYASEERFKAAFEYAPIGMALVGLEGSFLKVNRSLCSLTGYSRKELLAMNLDDLVYHDTPRVVKNHHKLYSEDDCLRCRHELKYQHRSGRPVWVVLNATTINSDSGEPLCLIVQVEDISGSKEAEDSLQKSEAKFRSYIESSLDGIHVVDRSGKYVEVNQSGAEMFGYTQSELMELSIGDIIAPGKTDGFDHFKNLVDQGKSKGEITCLTKDGDVVKAEINAVALENGLYMGVVRDITARKKAEELLQASEERFRSAFNYAPIGMALVSPKGRFIKINKSLTEILGYFKEELVGRKFQDITHPEDLGKSDNYRQLLLEGKLRNYWTEKRYLHKSGREVLCLLSATVIKDKNGKPMYFISQILDVTKQKIAIQALQEREQMYRALFEKSANPILVMDKEGRYIDCNREAEVFLQDSKDNILNRDICSYSPQTKEEMLKNHVALWGYGGAVETEYIISGQRKILDLTITPIIWQGKEAVIGIGRDITKQKQDEQTLRESEDRYRRLVEYFPNTISIINRGKIVYINNAGVQLLKAKTKKEIVGKVVKDTFYPGDVDLIKKKIQTVKRSFKTEVVETKVICLDGTLRVVEVSIIPFDYKGQSMVQLVMQSCY